jgi:hypothetical protein
LRYPTLAKNDLKKSESKERWQEEADDEVAAEDSSYVGEPHVVRIGALPTGCSNLRGV